MAILGLKTPRHLWNPTNPGATNLDEFRYTVNAKRHLNLQNYLDLHAWSTDPATAADFWTDLFEYENLKPGSVPESLPNTQDFRMFPRPAFFPDVRLNFAEHVLHKKPAEEVAIVACREGGISIQEFRWRELYEQVEIMADAMRQSGLKKGDRVAAIISNCIEAVIACLATLSIGAIFSTSSPDMGVSGIMARLNQIKPRLVVFETSILYNGKTRGLMDKVEQCTKELLQIREFRDLILVQREGSSKPNLPPRTIFWTDFNKRAQGQKLVFEQVEFDHPGFIVYSSGTTGTPKCIVHSAAGLLMKAKKDYVLGLDVRPDDVLYTYTTTGWIMWPLMLCGLSFGKRIVLYDGSPLFPDPMVTLRLISKLRVTFFGTSARFLTDLKLSGLNPRESIDLSALRVVTSTGSVLNADVAEWFYDAGFPPKIHLVSTSGGTDLAGSLVTGDPTSPVYAGEIQMPALGMAIDILASESETPVSVAATGQAGELVCRMPFPSQPVMFWGDNGNTRYKDAYFKRFGTSIWCQGDFVSMSPSTGGFVMLGRSDGVLNPSGVRFGSAEIYNAIAYIPDIEETICVGQRRPNDNDETVLLFVKTKGDIPLTTLMVNQIKKQILSTLTARHVPKHIFQVPEIPYTINGKKIELAVKQIVSGRKINPSGSVANPESLRFYERFVKLEEMVAQDRLRLSKL